MSKPLYESPDGPGQSERRLLLVSYHFPPDTSVGARRWEKLAHFAAERGWGIDVIMRWDAASQPAVDQRISALPSGVRAYGVPLLELPLQRFEQDTYAALRQVLQAVRAPFKGMARLTDGAASAAHSVYLQSAPAAPPQSIAREDISWALGSPRGLLRAYWAWLEFEQMRTWGEQVARTASQIVAATGRAGVHRAVVTSGPPHMVHDAGRMAAELAGLPLVMDMRDPWSHVERLSESVASPLWLDLAKRYEKRAVERSMLVVANTEVSRRNLQASYPGRRSDIMTVMNGADDDPLPAPNRGSRFVIGHAGTVYLDRDPRGLFQAAARVIRELQLTPDDIGLAFIGELEAVGGFPISEAARQEGIEQYVSAGPPRPHREAMQFMADSTMLVTMSGGNIAAIPAKTFECIRFPSWVLALSAPGSATELLLQGTNADTLRPTDVDGIAAAIRRRYHEHRAGVVPEPIASGDRFSRSSQAKILFDALEARLGRGGP